MDLRTKGEGIEDMSPGQPIARAGLAIQQAFPARMSPAEVVIEAPSVRSFSGEFERLAPAGEIRINPAGTVAVIPSELSVERLRAEILPAVLPDTGVTALVTGDAAQEDDFNDQLSGSVPWVFGFVLGMAFLLLLVSFRSVAIAVTGVVLNLLSVAAVGLAAAVLLDATIIRAVLLPAVMALLGEANWWLPRWLRWLPRVTHDVEPAPPYEPRHRDHELITTG